MKARSIMPCVSDARFVVLFENCLLYELKKHSKLNILINELMNRKLLMLAT